MDGRGRGMVSGWSRQVESGEDRGTRIRSWTSDELLSECKRMLSARWKAIGGNSPNFGIPHCGDCKVNKVCLQNRTPARVFAIKAQADAQTSKQPESYFQRRRCGLISRYRARSYDHEEVRISTWKFIFYTHCSPWITWVVRDCLNFERGKRSIRGSY